jgi:hypothetical protein
MSKKLQKYAKLSDLMKISIKYGGKPYEFNLFEELQISQERLNKELTEQASSYSFLTMLHKSLIKQYEASEARKKRKYAELYVRYKKSIPGSGRPPSDDLAKQMVEANKMYIRVVKATIEFKYQMGIIESAIRSYEQRKDMLQSLSANLRNEHRNS